jgi:hypothetical protein
MQIKIEKWLIYIGILIPIVFFFGMFFYYTVDIPINDDYSAILDFTNKIISTDSISEKIKIFFSQHNEHRIVYDRFWTLISYKIHKQLDLNFLALIGNLSLIPIFFIFSKKVLNDQKQKNLIYLVPISVLVFNISFNENMTFAMATMSNLTVFVFSLLSIHYLTKVELSKKMFALSVMFLIFAILTQGGGIFVIPIAIGILIFRKQKKFLSIFIAVSLILICLYFYGYEKPFNSPSIIDTLLYYKVRAFLFSLAFLGNAFNYYLIFTNDQSESIGITTIIGLFLLLFFIFTIKTKYYKKNLFAFSVMALIVLASFATGVTRCQLGLETAGASRYRINGVIFLLGALLWCNDELKIKNQRSKILIVIASISYFVFISIGQYEYLSFRKKQSLLGALYFQSGDYSKLNGFEQDTYKIILEESIKLETYFLPSFASLRTYFPYSIKQLEQNYRYDDDGTNSNIEKINKVKDSYLIEGWIFIENENSNNQKVLVGLQNSSQKKALFYSTMQEPKFDLNPYFKKSGLLNSGFFARIKDQDIEKGENTILLRVISDGKIKTIVTDMKLIK